MRVARRARHDGAMKIAILIFDKLTALDAIGPYEVLSRATRKRSCSFVAKEAGLEAHRHRRARAQRRPARSTSSPTPTSSSSPAARATGRCSRTTRCSTGCAPRTRRTTWTTSVCTGSLVLGAAGLLEGKRATSHWAYREQLREYGAEPVAERFVVDGKIVTAAGVSAGIDMALHLTALEFGEDLAKAIQLGIEYDPQPPFDSGSPEKADPQLVELVRRRVRG